jgi:hypothetical protein
VGNDLVAAGKAELGVNDALAPYALPYVSEGLRTVNEAAGKAEELLKTGQDIVDVAKPGAEGVRGEANIISNLAPTAQGKQDLKTAGTVGADALNRYRQAPSGNDPAPDSLDKAASGFGQNPLPPFFKQILGTVRSIDSSVTGFTDALGITKPAAAPEPPAMECYNCRSPQ